jgi:uncharacterized protein (DUF1015 family)
MAFIQPFRALRPTAARASAVAAVPYDVVSTDEARALASGNPLSFLHVTRSEIDLPPETDPYAASVYETARQNLVQLKSQAPLVLEDQSTLYVYRLRMGSHEQTGVGGCFSLDEYDTDVIKKHERTRRDKEDDRTRHILEVRAQTGVVFLTYRATTPIDAVTARITSRAPLYDFTAEDGVQHTVWAATAGETSELVNAFGDVPSLYIADGHHRAASAARAREELRQKNGDGAEANTFVAVAFPDSQTQILPYNRTVRDLAGHTPEQFLSALRARVPVVEGSPTPRRKGEVGMFTGGRWYSLDLSQVARADDTRANGLDVARLQRSVLEDILKIGDVRTDKRIDFVGGARGVAALENAVQSGKAMVAFSMFPVSVDDLMAVSDAGGIMPPKSTWFEPKIRDGLLTHVI